MGQQLHCFGCSRGSCLAFPARVRHEVSYPSCVAFRRAEVANSATADAAASHCSVGQQRNRDTVIYSGTISPLRLRRGGHNHRHCRQRSTRQACRRYGSCPVQNHVSWASHAAARRFEAVPKRVYRSASRRRVGQLHNSQRHSRSCSRIICDALDVRHGLQVNVRELRYRRWSWWVCWHP